MTREEAYEILNESFRIISETEVSDWGNIEIQKSGGRIDGWLSFTEIKALAWWMENVMQETSDE